MCTVGALPLDSRPYFFRPRSSILTPLCSVCHRVDEPTTRACIGAILAFLKQHHGSFDFSKIASSISGLDDLISEAEDDDAIPQIPKPQPVGGGDATTAADSPPVAPNTSSGSSSTSIFSLIVTIFRLLGLFAIIKQLLSLVPIVGQPAVRLIEGIEDGSSRMEPNCLIFSRTRSTRNRPFVLSSLLSTSCRTIWTLTLLAV